MIEQLRKKWLQEQKEYYAEKEREAEQAGLDSYE